MPFYVSGRMWTAFPLEVDHEDYLSRYVHSQELSKLTQLPCQPQKSPGNCLCVFCTVIQLAIVLRGDFQDLQSLSPSYPIWVDIPH